MSIEDIINAANEGNPTAFNYAVRDELNDRIMAQIDQRRQEIADTIFASDYEEVDMGDVDDEIDQEFESEEEESDEDV